MNDPHLEVRQALIAECKRIEENSLQTATTHFISATRIGRVHHWVLGPIPLLLGTTAAAWKGLLDAKAIPVDWTFIGTVLSALAGVSGSVIAFWNLAETKARHVAAATAFKSLQHEGRQAWQIHALDEERDAFKTRVMDLAQRYNKLNETSVLTADWAYRRARKKIKQNTFVTDTDLKALRATPSDSHSKKSAVPAAGDGESSRKQSR